MQLLIQWIAFIPKKASTKLCGRVSHEMWWSVTEFGPEVTVSLNWRTCYLGLLITCAVNEELFLFEWVLFVTLWEMKYRTTQLRFLFICYSDVSLWLGEIGIRTEVDTTHHLIKVDVPIPDHNCNMENTEKSRTEITITFIALFLKLSKRLASMY